MGDKSGPDTGWLGRQLSVSTMVSNSAFRAISISATVSIALKGASEAPAISNLGEFGFDQDIIDSGYPAALAELFGSPMPFHGPAQAALDELRAANLFLTG